MKAAENPISFLSTKTSSFIQGQPILRKLTLSKDNLYQKIYFTTIYPQINLTSEYLAKTLIDYLLFKKGDRGLCKDWKVNLE